MTIKQTQRKLTKRREQVRKLCEEIQGLIKSIQGQCDHSATREYTYTWSNGHGRHDTLKGVECVYCGWKKQGGYSDFTDPSTWRSQWDDD